MKYLVIAKILGTFLPEGRARIGDCVIYKTLDEFDEDRPTIPVRSKSNEFHVLQHGIRNFISYPQGLISVRTFESEYVIEVKITGVSNEREAIAEAIDKFTEVISALTLVAKNKRRKLGRKYVIRTDANYDLEVIGIFVKYRAEWLQLKLPRPLVNSRNYFPEQLPKGFLAQAKKYFNCQDATFRKGIIYLQRAMIMRNSGVFNELDILLNFVKCIELLVVRVAEEDNCGLSKKKFKKMGMKKKIEYVGKKILVPKSRITGAKEIWDNRNKSDIAHMSLFFNPYNKRRSHAIINFDNVEAVSVIFLTKYWRHISGV